MSPTPDALLEDGQVTRLPSPPLLLARLLEAFAGEEVSFEELTSLIGRDPALSARVIAVANTPYYYRSGKADSLKRVLITLGLPTVRTIAVTASVYQYFSDTPGLRGALLTRCWRHGFLTAVLARSLIGLTRQGGAEEAYLAGLLHDLGQLVLAVKLPDAYPALLADAGESALDPAAEREQIGVGHDELGARLLQQWGLAPFVVDAVRFHHEPSAALRDAHPLVRAVHLANLLAHDPDATSDAVVRAAAVFGLGGDILADLCARAAEEVRLVQQAMGVEGEADEPPAQQGPLAEQMQRHALLDAVRQQFDGEQGEDELASAILRGATILFDVDAVLLFEYDPAANRVRGRAGLEREARLNELELPLEEGRSVLAQSLLTRSVSASEEGDAGSVLDRQIARLLQRPVVVCLPLLGRDDEPVGVLVFGVVRAQAERLARQSSLLMAFAHDVAGRWQGWRRRQLASAAREEELAAEFDARARRVVHEANNPLTIMRNYLALLGGRLDAEHAAQDDLKILREEIDRVAGILSGLRQTPEQEADASAPVDLNGLVRDLGRLWQGSLLVGRQVELALDLDPAVPPLTTGRNALKQVLINLARNGVEAMGEKGRLQIATRDYVYLDGQAFVELTVADDGPGLPPQVLANLFRPVVSHKGGNHAGLGLSIVKSLVDELGGRISCRSSETGGATFQILLPRVLEG